MKCHRASFWRVTLLMLTLQVEASALIQASVTRRTWHKLSRAIHFDEHDVLHHYDTERRLIDRLTRDFAMQNYYKATKIANKLNLPKPALDLLDTTL